MVHVSFYVLEISGKTSHILDKPFSQDELALARDTFCKMKTYQDGTIHNSEFAAFFNAVGIPTTEAQAKLYSYFHQKRRGDDRINGAEVLNYIANMHDAKKLFLEKIKVFDLNGDGVISQEEFELGMNIVAAFDPVAFGEKGKIDFDKFLAEADSNGDGLIQLDELSDWLVKE